MATMADNMKFANGEKKCSQQQKKVNMWDDGHAN